MLFPEDNLYDVDYTGKDRDILKRFDEFRTASLSVNQSYWYEADLDTRFMAGDQRLWADLYNDQQDIGGSNFFFNRISRIVNMVDGRQRQNRKSTVVVGVENSDSDTADQFTKTLMWINNKEDVLGTLSDSFRGALITGMNLMHVWMDYREDPVNGNIKVDNCAYNSFLIDPFFRKSDLSDCNGIIKRSFLTKRECISLLPDHREEIEMMSGSFGTDSNFSYMPEKSSFSSRDLLAYDEFYYRDYRKQTLLVDTETGETQEWRSSDKSKLKEFVEAYPQIQIINTEIPTVKLAIIIQGKIFFSGPQPSGLDSFPFVPVFAYYYPELQYYNLRLQGIVRQLRDSQFLYNRRMIIQLKQMESTITTGYIFKEGVLVNPEDASSLRGEGKNLVVKMHAQPGDIIPITPVNIPQSSIEITNILGNEMAQISGVNEELLGSATDDKAGILSQLRQGAGLTTLQILFDNLDGSQKILGKIMIELIQMNFTPGKIKNILEKEEPTEEFYNKTFGRYDCVVEEGLLTSTQKQMQFSQLIYLREMGMQIPDSVILEASTMQNKSDLIKAIEQEKQQQAESQQAQQQTQMEMLQSQIELNKARAVSDQGLGLERISRVEENEALAVERRSQAAENEDDALLSKVKAMKELESMDMANLKELVMLAQMLRTNPDQTASGKEEIRTKENEVAGGLKENLQNQMQEQLQG